ncbi:hypothetical protein F4813DRAFT_357932 [Daldinia decipiens]|uniref:uncharacterized protein n=1 Tax=Daldinia decipiens TaxID=326647 RepID=UPI0020C31F34|nr:uncharacterized protein F4813DRAFT_357932 [Daldinia decipiens]KAI1658280.1 hypothetical protein F4813DRAFT_357932 [Daldinia decipiens]
MYKLGCTFQDQGKHAEAEETLQQVTKGHQRVYGQEHSNTLTSLFHLAAVFYLTGRSLKAEEIYRGVLKVVERLYG